LCSLTPCNRNLEKLTVPHLVKISPSLLWNPNIHYRVHNRPTLVPNLSDYMQTTSSSSIYFRPAVLNPGPKDPQERMDRFEGALELGWGDYNFIFANVLTEI